VHVFSWTRAAGALLITTIVSGVAGAQTLTLPNGTVYKAGPDYASDVLQDPWDFSNADDIAPDPDQTPNWAAPDPASVRSFGTGTFLANGRFTGVPSSIDPGVTLLYRPDAQALNPGRSGQRYPIDPARYRKLALKMRVAGLAGGSQPVAYWFHAGIGDTNWENRSGGAILSPNTPAGDATLVYVVDLAAAAPLPGQGSVGAAFATPGEVVKGLRIDPVYAGASLIEIDWVRLTASNSQAEAALMPISLSGCSTFQSLTVTDTAGVQTVITDSTGNNSSRSFNYGIFPPGAYNVRATCNNGSTPVVGFTINTPPVVTVIDPDETGDPSTDYALQARGGDRWDFEQVTDVARTFNVATSGGACGTAGPCGIVPRPGGGGNMLRASSVGSSYPQLIDPGLELLDGAFVPLNSRRHRLLTFSLRNNRPYELTAIVGPVFRALWSSQAALDANWATTSQDLRVWPGLNTYTVDLGVLATTNGGLEAIGAATPWMTRAIRHFRLDPHEYGDAPTTFDIDDVTLTAPDEVALGQTFAVRYAFSDADAAGATYAARIYREDWETRTGRTLIANLGAVSPGSLTYGLDPQARSVPAGRHAISIEVDETRSGFTQTSRAYATGPLVVYNASASAPTITVTPLVPGAEIPPNLQSYTIQGCAYDAGATSGIGMDDIAANAIGISGERAGRTIPLGFVGPPRGTLEFGPLGTPVICSSFADGSQFRNSGFRFSNVGLEPGAWIIRIYARSTVSGQFVQYADIPVTVGSVPLAPVNFQASAAGNTVTVSWQAPSGGPAVASYLIEGAANPNFSPVAFALPVGAAGAYSGQLASGTYYLRVMSRDSRGTLSAPSDARRVDVALPTPPGAPTLVAAQVASNPILLTWSPGPGGSPTSYTVYAGTSPGASNLAVAPMGLGTSISANAPAGTLVYVRVVAANAAGQATSNEVDFTLAPPAAPTMSPATVDNGNVTLRWTAVGNAASYTVLARFEGSPVIIASLPVAGGTTVTVPAPRGRYLVTVVANNGQGTSAESNQITVVVP
jgi:hypothetical protein